MSPFVAEFVGTALLVTLGDGVVANVLLTRTKGNNSGWIVITAGWALAVFVGVFSSQTFSGAHLNPAVTLAMAVAGKFDGGKVAGYVLAQMLGGFAGGALVFAFYREHFRATSSCVFVPTLIALIRVYPSCFEFFGLAFHQRRLSFQFLIHNAEKNWNANIKLMKR